MRPTRLIWIIPIFAAATALAHGGVKNPQVMARMNAMSAIADNMKILGQMAKGETSFDAAKAQAAATAVAEHAAQSVTLFEAPASDPKSEALPAIWENYPDFTDTAVALEKAALSAATTITSLDTLRAAVPSMGQTCGACHKLYRK